MKILFDHQIYVNQKFGGISRYFNELAKMKSASLLVKQINPALFEVPKVVVKTDFFSRGIRFAKRKVGFGPVVISNAGFPKQAESILRAGDFDILHPTYYDTYFLEYTDKPFVLTVYDMIHEIYKEYFNVSDITSYNKKLLCDKASHIIAISEKTKQDLIDIFGIAEEKITVILLASDFKLILSSKPNNLQKLKKYILFVGNRAAYKNFYYPVMALADILKADSDIQLVCTGPAFSSDEVSFFSTLGIREQVFHIYLENDNELAWVYENAHVFIFPSLYEGFGFPLLEAFATNCPVISSDGGSLPEIGGDAVLYFNPKDIVGIREVALKAIYDEDTRAKLIENGTSRLKEFNWQKCREQTVEVYKKVLNLS